MISKKIFPNVPYYELQKTIASKLTGFPGDFTEQWKIAVFKDWWFYLFCLLLCYRAMSIDTANPLTHFALRRYKVCTTLYIDYTNATYLV